MNKEIDQVESEKKAKIWLQRLQEESWEAELVISGVAIFGTIQLFKLLSWMINWFINILAPSQYLLGYGVAFMGLLAISILATMFVIHFLMRAYWVGLVGLNSVFPDYSLEDSAYSEIYTAKMMAIIPKLRDTIPKVDDLCSVIFSAAFFLFFMYGYFAILSVIFLLLYLNFAEYIPSVTIEIIKWILVGLVLIQMIFTVVANLKKYKQSEKIQTIYFKIIKWTSILFLGPLYKLMMQISMSFSTNYKRQKSLIAMVVFFLVMGFVVTITQITKTNIVYLIQSETAHNESLVYNQSYSKSANETEFLLGPQMESDIVTSPALRLFVPIYKYESRLASTLYGKIDGDESLSKKDLRIRRRKDHLERHKKYNVLSIDGQKVVYEAKRYYHPQTKQFGLLTYLPLENLARGEHVLTVKKELGEESKEWEIPFYYFADQ